MIRSETIFLIVAGTLFALLLLSENVGNLSTEETILTSKIGLNAISIANSFIEKVSSNSLYFDEYTLTNAVQPRTARPSDSTMLLTNLSSVLGPEGGEYSMRDFDDVDDFNDFDDTVGVADVGLFHVRCTVQFYDPSADAATAARTWYKIFTVTVTDTVPGSTVHHFLIQGEQAAIHKSVILSYYNFL
ncbi:MAG: hypothetical protein AB1428_08915 [Bacteroidota bacterium]